MNGDLPTGPAGLVSDDRGGAVDHSQRARLRRAIGLALRSSAQAIDALEGCSRQEAQLARARIESCREYLLEASRAAQEGERSGEGVHGEDSQTAEVSDAANDPIYDGC